MQHSKLRNEENVSTFWEEILVHFHVSNQQTVLLLIALSNKVPISKRIDPTSLWNVASVIPSFICDYCFLDRNFFKYSFLNSTRREDSKIFWCHIGFTSFFIGKTKMFQIFTQCHITVNKIAIRTSSSKWRPCWSVVSPAKCNKAYEKLDPSYFGQTQSK